MERSKVRMSNRSHHLSFTQATREPVAQSSSSQVVKRFVRDVDTTQKCLKMLSEVIENLQAAVGIDFPDGQDVMSLYSVIDLWLQYLMSINCEQNQ